MIGKFIRKSQWKKGMVNSDWEIPNRFPDHPIVKQNTEQWRCQLGAWNPLGFWQHGRLVTHGDHKKHFWKYFPAIHFYTTKYPDFRLMITVLQLTFCPFLAENCREIFPNAAFLLVTLCGYPTMIPNYQTDFMLVTDISNVLWKGCALTTT